MAGYREDRGDVNRSRVTDEQRRICLPHIEERLKSYLAAMKRESSVEGILFQARYHIPASFNPQNFMQTHCDTSNDKPEVTRYKLQFKMFADDAGSLVKAGCHIEDQGDTFRHIWTRISIKDEIRDPWRDMKNINIIYPRRRNDIDMRIVSHLQTPCCQADHPAYQISERIARSMTRDESGCLHMQVAAQDFCVVFIREKRMKTCSWIDPNGRNNGWTITGLRAKFNAIRKMELEYLRMRREREYNPIPVKFNDRVVAEVDFSGNTHATNPNPDPDDPSITVPTCTPDEFVAGFKVFVEASFCVADQLLC